MNVAFIVTDLGLGGTQRFVELAASALAERRSYTVVIAERTPWMRRAPMEVGGLRCMRSRTRSHYACMSVF